MALRSSQIASTLTATTNPIQEQGSQSLGYAANLNPENVRNVLSSREFIQDIVDYYGERDGRSFQSNAEAIDYFMSDRRWKNMNTVSMAKELMSTGADSNAQNGRLARLQTVFDASPSFYEEGGDGWSGFAENAAAAILDPINLIGFGSGGAAAKAAAAGVRAQAGHALSREALNATRREATRAGLRAGIVGGARAEGLAEGLVSGTQSALTQNRNINIGLQNEFSYGQLAADTALGTVMGGAIGAPMGAAGAVLPNPLVRGANGERFTMENSITRGIREGQQQVRADMRAGREAAALDAEANATPARTPQEEEDVAFNDTAARARARAERLTSQEAEAAAEAETRAAAESDSTPTVGTPDPNQPRPDSEGTRIRLTAQTMLDARRAAVAKDAQAAKAAEAGDVAKASELRAEAEALRQGSYDIKQTLDILDSDATAREKQAAIDSLAEKQKRTQTLLLPAPETRAALPAPDPNNPIPPTGQVYDEAGNPIIQLPDGSPGRNLNADEELRKRAIMPEVKVEGQPMRTNAAGAAAIQAEADAAQAQRDLELGTQQGERPGTSRPDMVEEAQIEERLAADKDALVAADQSIQEINARFEAEADPEKKPAIQAELDQAIAGRQEIAQRINTDELRVAQIKAERIQNSAERAKALQAVASQEDALATDPSTDGSRVAAGAEDGDAPDVEFEDADITPEAIADATGTNTNTLLDVLESLGHNRQYEQRVLKGLGDARTTAGKTKRREYLVDRLKRAKAREVTASNLKLLTIDNKFNRNIVEAMIETAGLDEVEVAHALDIYDKFLERAGYSLFLEKMADLGPLGTPSRVMSVLRETVGPDAVAAVEKAIASRGALHAEIPREQMVAIYKMLSPEQKAKMVQFKAIYLKNIKMDNPGIADADAERMAKHAVEQLVQVQLQRTIGQDPKAATALGLGQDIVDDILSRTEGVHMGKQVRAGSGYYNQNGRLVKGGDVVNKAQRMLQSANSKGYIGKLIIQGRKRDAGGNTIRTSAGFTALDQLLDSAIQRATNRGGEADPIKRARAVEQAKAADDDTMNPEVLEPIAKELNLATSMLNRWEKAKAEYTGPVDGPEINKIEGKIDEAVERLANAEAEARKVVQPGDADREGGLLPALRARISMLTKSTGKEAAGNRKEKAMTEAARSMITVELNARRAELGAKIRRHNQQVASGQKTDMSDAQVAALQEQIVQLGKDLDQAISKVGVAERRIFKEMKKTLAAERIAQNKLDINAGQMTEAEARASDEAYEAWLMEGLDRQEVETMASDMADTVNRIESANRQHAKVVNEQIAPDYNKMTKAELISRLKEAEAARQKRISSASDINTMPAGKRYKPFMVSVRGVEVDVHNDFTFTKGTDGTVEVRMADSQEVLGKIQTIEGHGFVFHKTADAADAPKTLFTTNDALKRQLPVMFEARIKKLNEDTSNFDVRENEPDLIYYEPDYKQSETYADAPVREITEADIVDPIAQPRVVGDPSNPLSMTEDNFDVPAGRKLAVQIIDPESGKSFKSVRVLSYKGNQSIGDVLKTSAKYKYVVGHVEAPYKSGSIGAEETFRPLDPEDAFYPANATEPVLGAEYAPTSGNDRSSRRMRKNRPHKLEDLAGKAIIGAPEFYADAGIRSVADLAQYVANLEMIPWAQLKDKANYDLFIQRRIEAGQLLQRNAPNGIERPVADARVAVNQLREVFAGVADDEIVAAEAFIMRLASKNQGQAPLIKGGLESQYMPNTLGAPGAERNRISIGDQTLRVDEDGKRYRPAVGDLVHEVGHWIYMNLMTESEKLQFWDSVGKYMTEDGFMIDHIQRRVVDGIYSNAIESPAEMFAHQFSGWVVGNGMINNTSLWTKIARKAQAIIKKFIKREEFEIDPDLVPIFQKYMPVLEIDPVTGASNGGVSRFAHLEEFGAKVGKKDGKGAALAGKQLRVLDERRIELLDVLNTSSSEATDSLSLIMTLERVQKALYGDYGGKQYASNHKIYDGQEGSGSTRIMALDGKPALNKIMQAQYQVHDFLRDLRAAGAYRYTDSGLAGELDIDDSGRSIITKSIADQMEAMDADAGNNSFEAQIRALRNSKAAYDALDWETTAHLHRLANNLIFAMEAGMKEYKAMFVRNMPKDARQGGLDIEFDTGKAFLRKPSQKSLQAMRRNKAKAEQELQEMVNIQTLIRAMNEADIGIYLDENSLADVKLDVAPARMSTAEIVTEASALPKDNKRYVDLANEMRTRENTQGPSAEELIADLSDDERMIFDTMVDRESAQRILDLASNGTIASGKFQIIAADYLRKLGVENPLKPTSSTVNKAINRLVEVSDGTDTGNGIPHGLPSSMKDHIAGLSHREKRVEHNQRSIFTKLMLLMGKNGDDEVISEYDLGTLVGQPGGDLDDTLPIPTNHPLYNDVRDRIRLVARLAKQGKQDEAIIEVAEIVYHMMSGTERDLLRRVARVDIPIGPNGTKIGGLDPNVEADQVARIKEMVLETMENGQPNWIDIDQVPKLATANKLLRNLAEHTSFVLNGVFDGGPQKPMMAAHGDMLAGARNKTPTLSAARGVDVKNMHPAVAPRAVREYISNIPVRIETAVRSFLGVDSATKLIDHTFVNVSNKANVRGITATNEGTFGSGIYIRRLKDAEAGYDPQATKTQLEAEIDKSSLSTEQRGAATEVVQDILGLRERIKSASQAGSPSAPALPELLRREARAWSILKDMLPSIKHNKVSPVFARIRNPFRMDTQSSYSLVSTDSNNIGWLMAEAAKRGLFNAEGATNLRQALPQQFHGADLFNALTSENGIMVRHGEASSSAEAKDQLASFLSDQGFDSLQVDDGYMMFNEGSLRELQGQWAESDITMHGGEKIGGDLKIGAQVAEEMISTGEVLDQNMFVGLVAQAQKAGMPDAAIRPLRRMAKGRELGPSDVERVGIFSSVLNYFSENSKYFRTIGANWFGDKIKPANGTGIYEMHDVELNNILSPIFLGRNRQDASLNNLPDSKTGFGRWMNKNRGLLMQDVKQPESHTRILQALRRGRAYVNRLNPQERAVALKIARAFELELNKMRELGIQVGDTRKYGMDFYVPQVWNTDAIRANPSKFEEAMVRFLAREQRKPEFLGNILNESELRAKAKRLFYTMSGDEGILDLVGDEVSKAVSDPFHQRMLRLSPEDYPELEGFLQNDLQALMAKYFDRTVRKRMLTKNFGVEGHALEAYKAVARGGRDAAVEILSSPRIQVIEYDTILGKAGSENMIVPRLPGGRETIMKVVADIDRVLGTDPNKRTLNKQAAMNVIINAQEAAFRTDPNFLLRAEAVVNAMVDFQKPARLSVIQDIDKFNSVLNKRPIDGSSGHEMKHKFSRGVRSFNSVSLLAYTTLSSIPDLALPLIRSGNMTAFARAWSKYASDPDYRHMAKRMGTGIENLIHDRMVQMAGQSDQKFTNAFFNFTLLTDWTNMNREVAAMVGFEAFKTEIDRASRLRREGRMDSMAYRKAVRFLERYGLTGPNAEHDFLHKNSFALDSLPQDEVIQNQLKAAMLRFTNEAIFTPNPNDVPMWAQTPYGAIIFQLKSFPLMMSRLSKDILKEAFVHGNMKPLMYMATAGVGLGMVSLGVKDFVQSRGGEDEKSRALRLRDSGKLGELIGVEEGGDADARIGWYLEGLLAMGGLGLFAEMMYNTSAQLDNGAYGQMRTMSAVFGPTVGLMQQGLTVAAGAQEAAFGDPDSNYKERAAVREAARRIPVAGGYRPFVEGVTDLVAGERGGDGDAPTNNWRRSNASAWSNRNRD